jgi:hypothetical protein
MEVHRFAAIGDKAYLRAKTTGHGATIELTDSGCIDE